MAKNNGNDLLWRLAGPLIPEFANSRIDFAGASGSPRASQSQRRTCDVALAWLGTVSWQKRAPKVTTFFDIVSALIDLPCEISIAGGPEGNSSSHCVGWLSIVEEPAQANRSANLQPFLSLSHA
jgi:hypothetical protein